MSDTEDTVEHENAGILARFTELLLAHGEDSAEVLAYWKQHEANDPTLGSLFNTVVKVGKALLNEELK